MLKRFSEIGIDGSKLSIGQLISFKDFSPDKLKSLTEEIQSISNADYGAFDTLKIQEYANALSDLEPKQAALLLSTQGLSNAQIEQVLSAQKLTPELQYQAMLEAGLLSSKQKLTTAQIEETLQTVLGSDADVQATMSAMGLKVATDAQGDSVAKLTKRNIEAAVASGKLTQEQALQLASMLGINMAVKKQASSTLPKWIATLKLSAKAIWENITATVTWLATTPAGWATLATIAIVGTTVAIAKHTKSLKDLQETAQNSKSAYDDTISEIKSLNDELKTTKDRIDELEAKDSLSLVEENELDKLKQTNDELERELRIKEAIAQTEGQQAAKDASNAITKKSERYNGHYEFGDADTYMQYGTNEYTYDEGDRIDAAKWKIEQAKQNNKELEDLYAKRKEIEDKYNNDASQFQNDSEWKANEDNINSKKAYIELVEKQAAEYIKALMDEDDALYDSNGNVIKGQEDLVNRLKNLYGDYDNYTSDQNKEKSLVDLFKESGIKENVAEEIKSQLSDDEVKQASTLPISTYINENSTIEDVRNAIKKTQEEADKSSVDLSVKFDPTSLLTESEDKSKSATLADLQSEADLLSSIQKEMSENGKIGTSTMQSIIKQYPEAKDALGKYMQGIISEQELFEELQRLYEDDTDSYIKNVIEKSKNDEAFFNEVKTNYPELMDMLSSLYGDDAASWANLAKAKQDIEDQLIQNLTGKWTGYFKAIKDAEGKWMLQANNQSFDAGVYTTDEDEARRLEEEHNKWLSEGQSYFQGQIDRANEAIDALNKYTYEQVKSSIDLSWQGLGKDSSSSNDSSSQTAEKLNWIERLINKISTAYSRLKNVVSDTTSTWLKRNNALSDSMNTLSSEINAQKQAYEYYMNAFNSYGLDGYWKDQIANGSISIDVIYDDDLKNAISDCQDFYDKAQDAKTAVQELSIELKGLAKTRFDNVTSQFEGVINKITAIRDLYSKEDDLMQEQGWFSSTVINESMIEQEKKNLERLEAEKDALTKALNSAVSSGKIEPESEDWYSMQASIDDVTSSIFDAKKALVEYNNAIRQINWDAFDRTRDDVSNLIDETEFLVGLLKDKGITDDNGNITNEGNAAQALIAQKYQLYLNQVQAYKDEILKIDEELANDPYDKELLDRKQELIKAQQDSINSAIDEKNALKDLVNDGLTTWSDKLSELIDKYKDLMTQQKNAHDYEKSIKEKTNTLNALQKQYSAYQGDNSEEGKKNIQQLKDQINTAKDDLKDTEYEKLISDTQAILDELQD